MIGIGDGVRREGGVEPYERRAVLSAEKEFYRAVDRSLERLCVARWRRKLSRCDSG
jgi:hypothetical protein